jgi:hypothetical protein
MEYRQWLIDEIERYGRISLHRQATVSSILNGDDDDAATSLISAAQAAQEAARAAAARQALIEALVAFDATMREQDAQDASVCELVEISGMTDAHPQQVEVERLRSVIDRAYHVIIDPNRRPASTDLIEVLQEMEAIIEE